MAEKRPRAARVGKQFEAKSKFYDYVSIPKFWFYQSDPGVKHDNKQCETCIFRSSDQSRQDKYVKGKRLKNRQHFNPHHKNGFKNPDKVKYVKLTKWISR